MQNFLDKFDAVNESCWLWKGSRNRFGYATWSGKMAHRLTYELFRGPIPEGLEIDHFCRVRWCVNPWHLEVVTRRENIIRGMGPAMLAARSRKTHCLRGHSYADSGVYWQKDANGVRRRYCRVCKIERVKRRAEFLR